MKAIAKQRSAEKSLLEPRSSSSIRRAPLSAEFFTWKTIPTCLTQETEDYAISFYFTSYGRPSVNYDERLCGFQDIILPIFSSSPDGSALKLSTMAIATLFFNTWRAPQPENPLSRSYYIKALSVINQQLKEKDQYTTDETILAVLILQLFEVGNASLHQLALAYHNRNSLIDHANFMPLLQKLELIPMEPWL